MTPAEFNPMEPELENAVSRIRDEAVDPAVIEAAAARVWARISEAAQSPHIRGCEDFQALIPEYRAGTLPEAKATLLKDHLHQCVVCRRVYEGRVVTLPVAQPVRRNYAFRWAAAAVVVVASGATVWFAYQQYGTYGGRAIVQTVNGTLYEVSAAGSRPLAAGQDLPDGVEIRTATASDAMLRLRDGSFVELRERSGIATAATANDVTVQLSRGSIIVQAAKRRKGHLYVATADCRVAVTGTVFGVTAGVKGSRVSVVEGEVRVSQDNQEKVLRPGEQSVTSGNLQPVPVRDDIAWSRNSKQMIEQLEQLRAGLQQIHLPALRYASRLLGRLPASTVVYGSIPNMAEYLGEAQGVFRQQLARSPELRAVLPAESGELEMLLGKLRAASEYLGEEIAVVGVSGPDGSMQGPVLIAETRKEGFAEFVQKQVGNLPVVMRSGLAVFGDRRAAVESVAAALDAPGNSFQGTPFYARINEVYLNGAGLMMAADIGRFGDQSTARSVAGARYIIVEHKEVANRSELRASLGFDGARTGVAAWLADPAPMGSLDYISPDATVVLGFAVKTPASIVDQAEAMQRTIVSRSQSTGAADPAGLALRADLAASLGGEFSLSLDGPPFPVPSWKLVAEVYDPVRMQASLQKAVEIYNGAAVKAGRKPLRVAQETAEGRTYHMIAAGDPNPLLESCYTFANGYMIAGPSRALVSRALQVKTTGTSITRSAPFLALVPKDRYTNFSALFYQNLGSTLAPIAGLLGAFIPQGRGGAGPNPLESIGNMKSSLIAVYGEPDRVTLAGTGDIFGTSVSNMLTGNLSGILGNVIPMRQLQGTRSR